MIRTYSALGRAEPQGCSPARRIRKGFWTKLLLAEIMIEIIPTKLVAAVQRKRREKSQNYLITGCCQMLI